MLVVVDPRHDILAINEAKQKGIPVVGIMSSDNNAKEIDYPVVINDTLRTSIALAINEITSAYEAGKKEYVPPTNATNRRPRSN